MRDENCSPFVTRPLRQLTLLVSNDNPRSVCSLSLLNRQGLTPTHPAAAAIRSQSNQLTIVFRTQPAKIDPVIHEWPTNRNARRPPEL